MPWLDTATGLVVRETRVTVYIQEFTSVCERPTAFSLLRCDLDLRTKQPLAGGSTSRFAPPGRSHHSLDLLAVVSPSRRLKLAIPEEASHRGSHSSRCDESPGGEPRRTAYPAPAPASLRLPRDGETKAPAPCTHTAKPPARPKRHPRTSSVPGTRDRGGVNVMLDAPRAGPARSFSLAWPRGQA